MAWKTQRTSNSVSVDVETSLDDFTEEQLLQGLIDAGWISTAEAEALQKRAATKENAKVFAFDVSLDRNLLDDAKRAIRRGDRDDALHYIEHFLGRDWIGVLQ